MGRSRPNRCVRAQYGPISAIHGGNSLSVAGFHRHDEAERRQVTVLFCDLVGSTALSSRLDPEDLREILAAYQRRAAEVIGRWAGYVARYMGDGVLAYFGYPEAHEDDAERATRAGLELVDAIAGLVTQDGTTLRVRIGIGTGLVVAGDLLDAAGSIERDAIGETPNRAARLQAAAEPNAVVVDANTRRRLGRLFDCDALGLVEAKGLPEPVPAWRVLRHAAIDSRSEALHLATPVMSLVGRDEELALLLRGWAQAKGGGGCVVLLSGEPGIGKSRLAFGLAERLAGEPLKLLRFFCSPYHQGSPLFPIIGQLERAVGFKRDDSAEAKLDKLEALLGPAARHVDVALIADSLGIPINNRHALLELSPQKRRERLLEALLALLQRLAKGRPVLILFEDTHWIDPTSLELLNLVIEHIRDLPVLLLVTFRPEFRPPWSSLPQVTTLALGGLSRREAALLVRRTAGETMLPSGMVEQILDRTGGVPLFLEELTRATLETDWHEGTAGTALILPPTGAVPAALYGPLMARLDRLGPAREIAQMGAAIGQEFPYELLAAVAGRPEAELSGALDRLVEAGLMLRTSEPLRATYLFKHSLLQDAAYGTLLRTKRKTLHARIAQVLEEQFPEIAEVQPELLGQHWAHAGYAKQAIGYWAKAAQQAIARSAMQEAAGHARKALQLIPALPEGHPRWEQELDLQVTLGTALIAVKGYTAPETGEVYERARIVCERLDDIPRLIRVTSGQCTYHLMRAELIPALRVSTNLLRRYETEEKIGLSVVAHRLVGMTVFQTGNLQQARYHLETAAKLLDRVGEAASQLPGGKDGLVVIPAYCSILLAILGHYDEARTQSILSLAEAERQGRPHRLAFALAMACWFHMILNEGAPNLLVTLEEIATEQKFPYWIGYGLMFRGVAFAKAGDARGGLELVQEGAALHKSLGGVWSTPHFLGAIAEFTPGGEERRAAVDAALARVESTGVQFFKPELYRIRAKLLADMYDVTGAERTFMKAISLAQGQGAKNWELRAGIGLARLWCSCNKGKEARDLLASICGWYPECLDTPDLRDARMLLDQIA